MPLDAQIAARLTPITTTTVLGRTVSALIAKPQTTGPAPGLVLFHAFKGLTDEFKELAVTYADHGYVTIAADLLEGKTSDGFLSAMLRMMFLSQEKTQDTAVSWVRYLRGSAACSGKVGTIGWCFGGRWSLNTSIATPVDATVVYYGTVDRPVADLAKLSGPVQGHFGTLDRIVKKPSVENFAGNMKAAGKQLDLHFYDANHAFANPGGKWFNAGCATQADARTLQFLKLTLG
ncbi:MAG: dienelactone hydrolase family protein [Rhodospirillaceae bacterium]|nr:dienelactone hydrolase family protein [Rhodospirillaceae bacterium]